MAAKTLDKTKNLNVVQEFFKQFDVWCSSSPITPTVHELEKYLTKNFQLWNNGQLSVKSSAEYLERLKKFQKLYSNFEISEPLEEPLINENQIALYYRLDLSTHKGQHKQIYILAVGTIEHDKISRWVEVTHEKGSGKWDA